MLTERLQYHPEPTAQSSLCWGDHMTGHVHPLPMHRRDTLQLQGRQQTHGQWGVPACSSNPREALLFLGEITLSRKTKVVVSQLLQILKRQQVALWFFIFKILLVKDKRSHGGGKQGAAGVGRRGMGTWKSRPVTNELIYLGFHSWNPFKYKATFSQLENYN